MKKERLRWTFMSSICFLPENKFQYYYILRCHVRKFKDPFDMEILQYHHCFRWPTRFHVTTIYELSELLETVVCFAISFWTYVFNVPTQQCYCRQILLFHLLGFNDQRVGFSIQWNTHTHTHTFLVHFFKQNSSTSWTSRTKKIIAKIIILQS